jgi:hypothetical protein
MPKANRPVSTARAPLAKRGQEAGKAVHALGPQDDLDLGSGKARLSAESLKLLLAMDPAKMLASLVRAIELARGAEAVQAAVDTVDRAGLNRMVVAVIGTDRTAERLGVEPKVARLLRGAKAKVDAEGYLMVVDTLTFPDSLPPGTVISGLRSVAKDLSVANTNRVSLPDLKTVGGSLFAYGTSGLDLSVLEEVGQLCAVHGSEDASLPALRSVGKGLRAVKAKRLSMPSLQTVGESMDASETAGLTFPALQKIREDLLARKAKRFSAPSLNVIGRKLDADGSESVSCPALKKVGSTTARDARNLDATVRAPEPGRHAAFHSSPALDIQSFAPLSHFGSEQAATDRTRSALRQGIATWLYEVELEIKNPLRIPDFKKNVARSAVHTPLRIADLLYYDMRPPVLTDQERTEITKVHDNEAESASRLIRILEAKGYDGMVYTNRWEDPGSLSWIIFHPEQVAIL